MPYSNIVFVKIQMELLEDDRFLIDLNDKQKGLYLMMLALAGKTNNNTRDDERFIAGRLGLESINRQDLIKISEIFPKFNMANGYWYFENFEECHNYTLGNSKGTPKEFQRVEQKQKENKKEKENKSREKSAFFNEKDKDLIAKDYSTTHNLNQNSESAQIRVSEIITEVSMKKDVRNPIGLARAIAVQA